MMVGDILYLSVYLVTEFLNYLLAYTTIFGIPIKKNKIVWILCIVGVALFHGFVFFTNGMRATCAFSILTMLVIPIFLLDIKALKRFLLYPFVSFGTSTFGVSLSFLLGILFGVPEREILNNHGAVLFCQSIPAIIMISIWASRKIRKKSSMQVYVGYSQYIIYYVGIACIFTMMSVMQFISNGNIDEESIMICGFAVSVACILFLLLILWQGIAVQNQMFLSEKNKLYESHLAGQEEHFRQIIGQDVKMRRFRHDLSAHMSALKGLSAEGNCEKIKDYLEEMSESSAFDAVKNYTGNIAVDAVLAELMEEAANKKIEISIKGVLPKETVLSIFELCTLFSNLTKNAIEACEKIDDGQKKEVEILISSYHEKVYMSVKNTVQGKVDIVDGKLMTTKTNKREHGFGSRTVEEIIDKYRGQVTYKCNDGVFEAEIIV